MKIKELARNHTQRQIADILGISQSAVKRAVEYYRKCESENISNSQESGKQQTILDEQSESGSPSENTNPLFSSLVLPSQIM
ncbi:MAG: helix-turn-helix domain-containing protein [Candidatus Nitrosopolaris sp.]